MPAPRPSPPSDLFACPDCDLLQRVPGQPAGKLSRCPRCGAVLRRRTIHGPERALAFNLAALILFLPTNVFPIVGLSLSGEYVQTTLLGTVRAMYGQGMGVLAALVLATTFLAPLVQMLAMIYLLLPSRPPRRARPVFRALLLVRPWGMVEVFVVGTLVALVKLAHLAKVVPGVALWSFGAVMLLMAAAAAAFDPEDLWRRWEAGR